MAFVFVKYIIISRNLRKCAMTVSVLSQPALAFEILVCFRAFPDSPVAEFETLICARAVSGGTLQG